MDFDLLDQPIYLAIVPLLSGLKGLRDERAGFVQVVLDGRLKGRGGYGASEGCPMVHLPRMIDLVRCLMDRYHAVVVLVSGRFKRTGRHD